MYKLMFFLATAALMIFGGCSEELKPTGPDNGSDTVFVEVEVPCDTCIGDTVYVPGDTVHDTTEVYVYDSTVVHDTVTQFCDEIENCHHWIVWILNFDGDYELDFFAAMESEQPNQTVKIKINDATYVWKPAQSNGYTITVSLKPGDTVEITTTAPHAYGHAIYICMFPEQI